MKTVYCPVKQAQVDGGDCLIICDVTDHMIKPCVLYNDGILPISVKWDENQRQKCLNCKYHYDIAEAEE